MALNIKNAEVERLAAEVAGITGESKTEAIRTALFERRSRLRHRTRKRTFDDVMRILEREVWPTVPANELGRSMTKAEVEELLGYGPGGV